MDFVFNEVTTETLLDAEEKGECADYVVIKTEDFRRGLRMRKAENTQAAANC